MCREPTVQYKKKAHEIQFGTCFEYKFVFVSSCVVCTIVQAKDEDEDEEKESNINGEKKKKNIKHTL